MSNKLLNKLQILNNTRERLEEILEEKGLNTRGENGFPQLVENVNNLYPLDYEKPTWNGVDDTPPENYFKPEINIDEIYNNDINKENYTNVAIYLIKVNDYAANLPQNAINSFTKYKFSDSDSLYSAVSTNQSPAHTWNKDKDIIAESGEHYRYIIGYSNTSTYELAFNNTIAPHAFVGYKGTYTNLIWKREAIAPAYTEIKSNCRFTGAIAGTGYSNYSAQTFICNAPSFTTMNNEAFRNNKQMRYINITSDFTNTGSANTWVFAGLVDCYVHLSHANNITGDCYFAEMENCRVIINECKSGTRQETGFNWHERITFRAVRGLALKIDTMRGYIGESMGNGSYRPYDVEIEIGEVFGHITNNAFHNDRIDCKGIKIGTVHGYIGNAAFYRNPLVGKIIIESNYTASDTNIIGDSAFFGTEIQCVDFANSDVTSVSNSAFGRCNKLTEIFWGRKLKSIGSQILYETRGIKTITLPDSVDTISDSAFLYSELEHIVFGSKMTTIPAGLFANTPSIKTIVLGDNVSKLNSSCFANTEKLERITLPSRISEIPASCFMNSGVKTVEVLGNLISIGENAFAYCEFLEELKLDGVETISNNAFLDTNFIVNVPSTLSTFGTSAFQGIKGMICNHQLSTALNLSYNGFDKNSVLPFFHSLPVSEKAISITISPTRNNSVTNADRKFWSGIMNEYVHEVGGKLEYCASNDEGATKLSLYMSNKNYTIA